ncbi:MAG: Gfo/Idh/MocA family oxidoreductase [Treponema sp.]|jgi:predicted dehydrogenase|nr:Gfo/Idh/MocA family oxidoreductase [Treponema sp.]
MPEARQSTGLKPLKTVLIGGGERARTAIYPAFDHLRQQGTVEIAGICHTNAERREEFAGRYRPGRSYGAGGVHDYKRMLEELKPEAAVVVGHPNIMYDCWIRCLEQGLHLFIEKPLGLSIHQARALAALAGRNKRVTQVAFQRRYSPMVTKLREECLKRGKMTQALCKFYKSEPCDNFRARDHMMDDTVHAIDTLRWMAGSEIVKVDSVTGRIGTVDINLITAQFSFANGCVGHLLNNWSSGKRIFAVEMHAPGIFVEAEHEGKGYMYTDGNLKPLVFDAAESAGSGELYIYTGVLAAAEDFVNCCLRGGEPACSFGNSVNTMKIAEVILAQSLLREGL